MYFYSGLFRLYGRPITRIVKPGHPSFLILRPMEFIYKQLEKRVGWVGLSEHLTMSRGWRMAAVVLLRGTIWITDGKIAII